MVCKDRVSSRQKDDGSLTDEELAFVGKVFLEYPLPDESKKKMYTFIDQHGQIWHVG